MGGTKQEIAGCMEIGCMTEITLSAIQFVGIKLFSKKKKKIVCVLVLLTWKWFDHKKLSLLSILD